MNQIQAKKCNIFAISWSTIDAACHNLRSCSPQKVWKSDIEIRNAYLECNYIYLVSRTLFFVSIFSNLTSSNETCDDIHSAHHAAAASAAVTAAAITAIKYVQIRYSPMLQLPDSCCTLRRQPRR